MRTSHGDKPHRRTDSGRALAPVRTSALAALTSSLILLLGPALGSAPAMAQSAAPNTEKGTRLASNDAAPAAPVAADAAAGPAAPSETSTTEAASDEGGVQEVVITGSHIARSDFDSPQPVTAISAASLEAAAPSNIMDFAVTIPALAGSTTVNNSSGALSNGEAGVAALNLRNLGTNRTLVLVDGQRWVPSTIEGLVDVNTIPQSLISGIDVTTGGASAAYGSGAVGGVINFILDKKFTGVKADYQYGEYQLYDDPQNKFTLTAGTGFAEGRGHVLFSGEVFGEQGNLHSVPAYDENGYFSMPNTAANIAAGGPQVLAGPNLGLSTYTPGGLITSGPLKGTYFGVVGANGVPAVNQLAYGSPVNGQWMQGGDWKYTDSGQFGSTALIPHQDRDNLFGRVSFDLNDNTEVYSELSWARYHGFSYYDAPTTTGISISINNPFLPASVASAMKAANVTSFTMGTSNAYFGPAASDTTRVSERANFGADGSFQVFGQTWKWDTHALIAQTADNEQLPGTYNNANFANAINAITGPNGTPVCASGAAGCVPLNIFGVNPAQSAAARAYVLGDPTRHEWFQLDEGAADFSTNDFAGWAGPISLALGAEGRREAVTGNVPVQYDPTYGNYWKYGNYVATHGSYTVAEGYVETLIPLLKGLNFNGAARYTDYSTSGGTDSWKLGLTWSPISDITFRATRSADIRAGNLAELFSPGTARTNSVTNDFDNNNSLLFVQKLEGSKAVQPETAKTDVVGVVFQPSMAPGLQASVDYYSIKISDLISDLSAQQEVDACYYNHVQKYCDNLLLNGFGLGSSGASTPVIVQVYENLYRLTEKGMDFEASYPVDLSSLWSPLGKLTFHAIATHYINFATNNGITNVNLAGSNSPANAGATPNWMARLETMYTKDSWSFDVVSRIVSPGNLNDASDIYIQCSANCKAGTGVYKTANITSVPGQIVFDGTISKKFDLSDRGQANVYLMVRNVLNRQPPVIASLSSTSYGAENVPAYPQTNTYLYDYLGREFTLGVKVQF